MLVQPQVIYTFVVSSCVTTHAAPFLFRWLFGVQVGKRLLLLYVEDEPGLDCSSPACLSSYRVTAHEQACGSHVCAVMSVLCHMVLQRCLTRVLLGCVCMRVICKDLQTWCYPSVYWWYTG